MIELKTQGYTKGIENKIPPEIITQQAGSDALSWISYDGYLELSRGRQAVGDSGALGSVGAQLWCPKKDGTKVHFRKIDTKIQYWDGTDWQDVVTGLTSGSNYSFNSYISLAGAYLYATGVDGIFKIATANPGSYKQMYSSSANYSGFSIINEQRMFMWDISAPNVDKTGVYLSKIDPQGTNYSTVSSENLGASGSTTYSGTLAQATGLRFVFGLVITGTTGAGVETFTDDYCGNLTGSLGGTGTINYATGAYSVTFNGVVTTGNVQADYQYEDSNSGGITDFTFSAPRVAGEGDIIPQEYLGEPIQNILVYEGKYYSFKKTCVYELDLTIDDTNATNIVYRQDIGIPSMRASYSVGKGMVYMDTSNPNVPRLSILQRNPIGGNLEPVDLTPLFKWEDYQFDNCVIDSWGEFIIVSCKTQSSTYNDRLILVNTSQQYSPDISYYGANVFSKNEGLLYAGDDLTQTTYEIFSGFDDLGDIVENYWEGKAESYGSDNLKRFRWLRFKGVIDPDQAIGVYCKFDDGDYVLLGTIRGDQSYVDYSSSQAIGTNGIGTAPIGGALTAIGYNYLMQIRVRVPKFRVRTFKFIATGVGYASIQWSVDFDVLSFEQRIPSQYRQKQHISLDGAETDLPTFPS